MSRRGYTLAEVLVAIGIIGLLIALLMPAVQHAREQSRRASCVNNLRQLSLAAHQYESANRAFPYTSTSWIDSSQRPWRRYYSFSPHATMLAFLEPAASGHFDWNAHDDAAWTLNPQRSASAANQRMAESFIGVFACPSDTRQEGATSYRANMGVSIEIVPLWPGVEAIARRGAFVNGRSVRASEFADGLSNTAFFSERVLGDFSMAKYTPFRDVFARSSPVYGTAEAARRCRDEASWTPPSEFSYSGSNWLFGGWLHSWYNHVLLPNSSIPDCGDGPGHTDGGRVVMSARSMHPGGVHVSAADASVRFVSASIDETAWKAFGTRNSGEILPVE